MQWSGREVEMYIKLNSIMKNTNLISNKVFALVFDK